MPTTMTRPTPRFAPPEGTEWVARREGDEWTAAPWRVSGLRCRWGSPRTGYCQRPAIAALNRSHGKPRPRWYGYCDDPQHLYGRWVEDGAVMDWRAQRVEP